MNGKEHSFDSWNLGAQDRFTLNSGIENRSSSKVRLPEIVGILESLWDEAFHASGIIITTNFHNPS
jgi:hypothetical protein